jgi:endonuclease YncB( thermonuclease family)
LLALISLIGLSAPDWPRYSRGDYAGAQREAERSGKGMWAGSFSMPWDYRRCIKAKGRQEWCSDEANAGR